MGVMQPIQHGARADRTGHWSWTRRGCLQSECPMRSLLVVVLREFAQHGHQVLLVEHDEVVEAFSAKCPDHSFDDRVRARRSNGRSDGIDTNAPGSLAKVAAVDPRRDRATDAEACGPRVSPR